MATINLLPWREERRQEKKREFLLILGATAVVAALVVFLVHTALASQINSQNRRNQYLQEQITQLDKEIREIKELDKQRQELISRMDIIQKLQKSRPEVVHLFDELVRTVPEGVHLMSWERKGKQLSFKGQAESNPRVSEFLRKIDASDWMKYKDLKEVVAAKGKGIPTRAFVLDLEQDSPSEEELEQNNGGAK